MKKILAVLLALAMVFALAACGEKKDPAPEETIPEEDNALSYTFTKFGKAKITILGEEFVQDEDGEDFLRVYYNYLNQDETAAGHVPSSTLDFQITQNGEELDNDEFTTYDDAHIPEDLFLNCSVQPGIPVRNTLIVYCSPDDGPVDIACTLMVGSWAYNEEDLEWFKFQVDPENLREAPKDSYEIKPITNPTYAKDMPSSGTSTTLSNPFTISLNGYELTTCDGEPALRVKMTYTHQHDWEMSPYTALTINAYQDGIALEQGTAWDLDDATAEDDAFEADVAKGDTVECNAIFFLRGESPVEVVVEQPLDDLRAGMICNVQ